MPAHTTPPSVILLSVTLCGGKASNIHMTWVPGYISSSCMWMLLIPLTVDVADLGNQHRHPLDTPLTQCSNIQLYSCSTWSTHLLMHAGWAHPEPTMLLDMHTIKSNAISLLVSELCNVADVGCPGSRSQLLSCLCAHTRVRLSLALLVPRPHALTTSATTIWCVVASKYRRILRRNMWGSTDHLMDCRVHVWPPFWCAACDGKMCSFC